MTALDLAKEWLRYAKSDLNTAKHMFRDVNPKETEISCYHTHQCAEKSLKAFLIARGVDYPYIHDLVEINKLCIDQEANFSSIQPFCASLNPYGVQVRYPNELAVDDSITGQAINYAEKILEFCEKVIFNKSEKKD
jgi:HEPN domain-containing protein